MSSCATFADRQILAVAPDCSKNVTPDKSVQLVRSPECSWIEGPYSTFRISAARTTNDVRTIGIRRSDTNESIGCFDIRYPVAKQSFDAELSRAITDADIEAGIELYLKEGEQSFGIISETGRSLDAPHLLPNSSPATKREALAEAQLLNCSISEIGWMEGCILEGLAAHPTIDDKQLCERTEHFFAQYGSMQGLEGTLPAATLARLNPESPFIQDTLALWKAHREPEGYYSEGGRIVAESCLTVAYPMAIIARQRNDRAMAEEALQQLHHCSRALLSENDIALRCFEDGERVFLNWGRGVGWFILGHAKTIEALEGWVDTSSARAALESALGIVCQHQRDNGIWGSFIDDPACLEDTSGSVIIALAMAAYAQTSSPKSNEWTARAQRSLDCLITYLSPDGLLQGSTQHNCGGEELQRGDYRVNHPYTLGLLFELQQKLEQASKA